MTFYKRLWVFFVFHVIFIRTSFGFWDNERTRFSFPLPLFFTPLPGDILYNTYIYIFPQNGPATAVHRRSTENHPLSHFFFHPKSTLRFASISHSSPKCIFHVSPLHSKYSTSSAIYVYGLNSMNLHLNKKKLVS